MGFIIQSKTETIKKKYTHKQLLQIENDPIDV